MEPGPAADPAPSWAPVWRRNATLIALEGPDGAGKTTAGLRLVDELRAAGHAVTWHPNRSLRPVRRALEELAAEEGHPDRFAMLGRDHAQLISAVAKWRELLDLREDLARHREVVVVDRYKYAHIALTRTYGTTNEGLVRELYAVLPDADVVYYFDVDPAVAAERVRRRGVDTNATDFLAGFARAYRELPEFARFTVLRAADPPKQVFAQLWADISGRLAAVRP